MKRTTLLARICAVSAVPLLLSVATPARAQRAEGWQPWKTGDIAISPMMLGPSIYVADFTGTLFALFTDFDYHVAGPIAVGAIFDMSFRGGFFGLSVGPQFKYKFNIAGTSHSPYVRFGLPFVFGFPSGGDALAGMGIFKFGGGYKYFFHRMIGAGMDINFTPTIFFTGIGGGTAFAMAINLQFGIEIKL